MIRITIDREICRGSGECLKVCPENAISIVDGIALLDQSRCDFDGICIPACPLGAISYEETEPGGCGF